MKPDVGDWLAGKDILITGATGYVGKVLVEKLLRSCPKVNNIYAIVRPKRSRNPSDRMKDIVDERLFATLLETNPTALNKIVVIPGNGSLKKFGLSEEHQQLLRNNVSVVFHGAASIRFDDSITNAFKLNTRGTYELIQLAKEMKKLEVFQYVSTTFSNINDPSHIAEKIYPQNLDWKVMMKLVDEEEGTLDLLTYKLQQNHPNTYTLTKSLAENVILEHCKELPLVLVRLSIVLPILQEPTPGWMANLSGAMGVTAAVSKGVLRTMHCAPDSGLDCVPADYAVNGMIAAAWSNRFLADPSGSDLQVFNQIFLDIGPISCGSIANNGKSCNEKYPMENYIWYPFIILTKNKYLYHFLFFFLQLLPALFLDLVLTVAKQKRMLLQLNIKIYNTSQALNRFTTNPFNVEYTKGMIAHQQLSLKDQKRFYIGSTTSEMKLPQIMEIFMQGMKKYHFKERDEDSEYYGRVYKGLYYIHHLAKLAFASFVVWKAAIWTSDWIM